MPDGVILRRQFSSSVDQSLELVAVLDLLFDAEVLSAGADDDGQPLVSLRRGCVALDGASSELNGLEDEIALSGLVAFLTENDGRQVHRLAKPPKELAAIGKLKEIEFDQNNQASSDHAEQEQA